MKLKLLIQTILDLMNNIEKSKGLIDSELETRCFEAMDSKNAAVLNNIIKELENKLNNT